MKETAGPPTVEEAEAFVAEAEQKLGELAIAAGRADWVKQNFITYDTEIISAKAGEQALTAAVEYAQRAPRYDGLALPEDVRRKLNLIKQAITVPAPSDPAKTAELSTILASMDADYGRGKYCPPGGECKDLEQLSDVMAESRDPKVLLDAWAGWHSIAPPLRARYERYVALGNEGAVALGYKDLGAFWRSKYDMPADDFSKEVDRLWGQVKPLYDQLHCYVRAKLAEQYGAGVVKPGEPIPAHLLGNMWAQDWTNVYKLVAPGSADPGYDLTDRLKAKGTEPLGMVKYGEGFFTSLGFAPLPQTFWERSLFLQPKDRDVVCHASAWDIDNVEDLRIKMCIQVSAEDFNTIHHELGHNFYQRAYNKLPMLFRDSANDGFHEAVGDTIALSVTPEYLKKLGLIDQVPDPSKDIGLLLDRALEKIAFLPFGLLVDQWRWKTFSGEIKPADYNKSWWELRRKYQGVAPPIPRTEADFDPAAKYHVAGSVPYTRYFLAAILQFQFHRALCQAAGIEGPLNRCSIYGNKAAGEKLEKMLAMGASRPWPDALEALTGSRQMDATAIVDYFKPLLDWLKTQNKGQKCGW
ncbi:MAG TPA: M2 family metallopeptidase [Thermoanaerobaculia bacterium]|nr:M2 family metallopeptidase [Thermoanaerobaculia bacterium]